MKKALSITLLCITPLVAAMAQQAEDYAVQISATVQDNPARITLNWVGNPNATAILISRKSVSETGWGTVYATLPGSATSFEDNNVLENELHEYRVEAIAPDTANGYITSGIRMEAVHARGVLLFVLDTTYAGQLNTELEQIYADLHGDGWKVKVIDVDPSDAVSAVKDRIVAAYNIDPTGTESVLLFGHVPVPYAGEQYPDGHPDHEGAWPADGYYGDVDGSWSDAFVNNTNGAYTRNHNVPGDGKLDQWAFPSDVDLQVGRVDLYDLPAFSQSEQELLRRHLVKDHGYRHGIITAQKRALIDDNFGAFNGEAFAATGWRNFPTLVGSGNIDELDYDGTLSTDAYLWSYGCGGGSFTSCSQVVNTGGYAADSLRSIFTFLFGSYFGDWDSQNNLLRAALASGSILTNCWSGRPFWQFHHMAMGQTIGHAARLTMNNESTYVSNYGAGFVHIGLMGDPTLRADVVRPPSDLLADHQNGYTYLSWTSSPDPVIGYHLYRKDPASEDFTLLNIEPVIEETFTDSTAVSNGENVYMVRAVKLEETTSGSYYNLSQGIFDTAVVVVALDKPGIGRTFTMDVFPNPVSDRLHLRTWTEHADRISLTICDAYGRTVLTEELRSVGG